MERAFVYIWLNIITEEWYIGSRTAKGCHPNDGYICSSKIVKPMILSNPEQWVRQLIYIGDRDTALLTECSVLREFRHHPNCLNQSGGGYSRISTYGRGRWNRNGLVKNRPQKPKSEWKWKISAHELTEICRTSLDKHLVKTYISLLKKKPSKRCKNIERILEEKFNLNQ